MQALELKLEETPTEEYQDAMYDTSEGALGLQPGLLTEVLIELMRRENIYCFLPTEPSPYEYMLRGCVLIINLECLLMIHEVNLMMGQINAAFGFVPSTQII